MRTVKKPDVRRREIMDAAEGLFARQSVADTSVNDIVAAAGVAKGTFYWHFKSKDELLDALVQREHEAYIGQVEAVIASTAPALEKLRAIYCLHERFRGGKRNIRGYFHRAENTMVHQKHLLIELQQTCPLLARVFDQGVTEGVFDTKHTRAAAEFVLLTLSSLHHTPFFTRPEEQAARLAGVQDIMERALGAKPGSLQFLFAEPGPSHDTRQRSDG